jgi:hypothetical protein
VTSRWGRWRNRGGGASPLDPEQDQGTGRRPASRVGASWGGVHGIDQAARCSVQLAGGAHVLATGVVVAAVASRPDPLRPDVSRPAVSLLRRVVSRAMRSGTDPDRALGDLRDRECEKGPEDEANTQRAPLDHPPLPLHGAHPTTAPGTPSIAVPPGWSGSAGDLLLVLGPGLRPVSDQPRAAVPRPRSWSCSAWRG